MRVKNQPLHSSALLHHQLSQAGKVGEFGSRESTVSSQDNKDQDDNAEDSAFRRTSATVSALFFSKIR